MLDKLSVAFLIWLSIVTGLNQKYNTAGSLTFLPHIVLLMPTITFSPWKLETLSGNTAEIPIKQV